MKTIQLDGIVGQEITVDSVVEQLPENNNEKIRLEVNSPGGDYFVGLAIYNKLKMRGGEITIDIIGLAASAMALIAMAASPDKLLMRPASRFMIHKPSGGAFGNDEELERVSDELKKMNEDIEKIHSERMGLSIAKVRTLMEEETHITPEEAEKLGFAKLVEGKKGMVKNHFKDLKSAPAFYCELQDEYDPSEVFKKTEFSLDAYEVKDENPLIVDDVVNINALRYVLAFDENEEAQKLLDEFKQANPGFKELSKIKLIQIHKGKKNTFLFTAKEINMQKEILELLGVDTPEAALLKIEELKNVIPGDDKADDEMVVRLQKEIDAFKVSDAKKTSDIEKLTSAVEALTEQSKQNTDFAENQKLEKRDNEITTMKENGFMVEAEATDAVTYWEADKITGLGTYTSYLKDLKANKPRYAHLLKAKGSEGDEDLNIGNPVDGFEAEVQAKMKADTTGKTTYDVAVELVNEEKPELFKAYNEAITS